MALHRFAITALIVAASLSPVRFATSQENPGDTFSINLKNVDIYSLIETVSMRTGKNFIVDPRVKATVSVVSSEPVNADKFYEIFLSVLEVHGFTAVESGKMTKIIPSSIGKQSAVPLLRGPSPSEAGDEMATRIIHLKRIPAPQVIEVLRPLLSQSASVSAESTNNAVIITDRAANIQKLVELITLMDSQ